MAKLTPIAFLLAASAGLLLAPCSLNAQTPYKIGDADWTFSWDIDDCVYLVNFVFAGGPEATPCHVASGDADWSYTVDIDDVVYIIDFIFGGGPPPPLAEEWATPLGPCVPGDANNNGIIDVDDMAEVLDCSSDPYRHCFSCGDANGDGTVNANDANYIANFLYSGGPAPILSPLTIGGCLECPGAGVVCMPGDANKDGIWTTDDVVLILNCYPNLHCNCCADANGDGVINGDDANLVSNYIFAGSPKPVPSRLTYREDCACVPCRAGDANTDGRVTLDDLAYMAACLPAGDCICCADANGDGAIDNDDVTYLEDYLFFGGPAPATSPLSELWCIECLPGDVNKNGVIDVGDIQALIDCTPGDCPCCADVDGDGDIDAADATYLTDHIYSGGPAPEVSPLCF